MQTSRLILELALLSVFVFHVVYSPYTKIEEAWTLHATHDILKYGVAPEALSFYDHKEFPGPVPRSFVGPLCLAGLANIGKLTAASLHAQVNKLTEQIIIRITLSLANGLSLIYMSRQMTSQLASRFLLLTMVQFHLPFWAGRTIPNMVVFPFVQLALTCILLKKRRIVGLGILANGTAILRSDLLPILLVLTPTLMVSRLPINSLLALSTSVVVPLILSIYIDGYFWGHKWGDGLLWPELHSVFFNAVQGKSAEWGVSPAHYYFSHLLPRLLLLGYPCSVLGLFTSSNARKVAIPAFASIALLSSIGHKEWRFISYVIPLLNISAVSFTLTLPRTLSKLLFAFLLASSVAATLLSTYISHHNYPGGAAMDLLHQAYRRDLPREIHIDIYSKMTGASLFTQVNEAQWSYNRSENLRPLDYAQFQTLVTHGPLAHPDFSVQHVVTSFKRLKTENMVKLQNLFDLQSVNELLEFTDAVYIMEPAQ